MSTFDPSIFVGFRVKFNVLGDEFVGILESYNPSTDVLRFKYASVYIIEDGKLEAVSDYQFPRKELYHISDGVHMVKDDRDGGKFNNEVIEKKLKALKLEEEQEEEEEKPIMTTAIVTGGAKKKTSNDKIDGNGHIASNGHQEVETFIKIKDETDLISFDEETGERFTKLGHIINGHPSTSSSSSGTTLSSLSSPEKSPRSTVSVGSCTTDDPNLPRAPDHDSMIQWLGDNDLDQENPIKELFAKCEQEEKEPDEWKEEDELNPVTSDVEFWPDKEDLPSIEEVNFVDSRKETFDAEMCEQLTQDLLNYDQISIDAFGESIARDKPIEYVAICGANFTQLDEFNLTIYLFPFQLSNKITKRVKNIAAIIKSVVNSRISKLVHCCVFVAEALKERHDIDIRLPVRSLIDTSILDAKHREDMKLRKTLHAFRMKEELLLRSLEECLEDYLDIEMTAEFFPNYQKEDEYLCLQLNDQNDGQELTNSAKNFLIRKVGLLFSLESEIKNRLFGIIDAGTQMLASKLITLGPRNAAELRSTYQHDGIKAKSVLVAQVEDVDNIGQMIGQIVTSLKTNGHRNLTNGPDSSPEQYPSEVMNDVRNYDLREGMRQRIDWGTPQVVEKAPPPGGVEYKWWKNYIDDQAKMGINMLAKRDEQEVVVKSRSRGQRERFSTVSINDKNKTNFEIDALAQSLGLNRGNVQRPVLNENRMAMNGIDNGIDTKNSIKQQPTATTSSNPNIRSNNTYTFQPLVPTSTKCPGLRRKQNVDQQERFRRLKAAETGTLYSSN